LGKNFWDPLENSKEKPGTDKAIIGAPGEGALASTPPIAGGRMGMGGVEEEKSQ